MRESDQDVIYCGRFGKLLAGSEVAPKRFLVRLVSGSNQYLFSVKTEVQGDPELPALLRASMGHERTHDDLTKAEIAYGFR